MPWFLRMMLGFLPIVLVAYAYSGWKLYDALARISIWPKEQIRLYILAVIGLLNLHPLLLFVAYLSGLKEFARSVFDGIKIWDVLLTYPFWIGVIVVLEVVPYFVAMDLIKAPLYPFYRKFKPVWLDWQSKLIIGLLAFFVLYVVIRIIKDTYTVRVTKEELNVATLPASLDGFRIVHISDVQADSRTGKRKLRRYVKKVNRLNPDLVFFTGDVVTSQNKHIQVGVRALDSIHAKYGVYACIGDHDFWTDREQIVKRLNDYGMVCLEDANYFVRAGFDSLLVTFITNIYSRRPNLDQINSLMGSQPRGAIDVVITHQPSENLMEMAAERGYHLFLAGHTHGGQVVLRPFGIAVTPTRIESSFFRGIQYLDGMLVSINNGLGLTFAPFRYQAPAEVTLITLRKASGALKWYTP